MSYLNPLLALGSSKVLDAGDIGVPSQQDRSERAYEGAKAAWEQQLEAAEKVNEGLRKQHEEKWNHCKTEEERNKLGKEPSNLKEPSMSFTLVKSFGTGRIVIAMMCYVLSALLGFVPVLILNDLVKFFEHVSSGQSPDTYDSYVHPWVEVVGLGILPFLVSLLQTRHQIIMAHCGVFVRTAVSTLLYRKSITVSAAGRAKTPTGQVVNMMSNDTMQLQRFLQFAGMTFVAPIQIVVALYLIYQQVGNATWVGVGYMVFLAPINAWVFSTVAKFRKQVLQYSDLRVKMMNEILTGIRILKFYAWEGPFGKEVGRLREQEVKALTKLAYTTAIGFSVILLSTPIVQPIIVFLTYIYVQDQPLSAATAFTTVALFNMMRFPFAFLPMGLLQYIQSKISLKRLERYLALPELVDYVVHTPHPDTPDDSPYTQPGSITIKNGNFSWVDPDAAPIKPVQEENEKKEKRRRRGKKKAKEEEQEQAEAERRSSLSSTLHSLHSTGSSASLSTEEGKGSSITLQDINCEIKAGSLVACVGSVGSGKSSLLSAILGEMEPMYGSKVYAPRDESDKNKPGIVSYCSQSPWVVNDTIRGNILFGREFDEDRYNQVVQSCALLDDLAILPAGDMTEIGERGINLSGGQKARVALARSLYSPDTKLLLLDDPLSAVDSHVGEQLFKEVKSV
jgi:ABC-type multidrug transport system fused ATPase/permease subunit